MNKTIGYALLSLGAPFLVVIALLGFLQREGNDRLQSLPVLIVGSGLIVTGALGRSRRRFKLLLALRSNEEGSSTMQRF